MEPNQMAHAIENCEFFKDLSPGHLDRIAELCRPRNFEQGEYVFQQGDFGEHLFIVVEGQVLLERSINLGLRKGNVTIETLGKGRVLGCWSTLLGKPHILMSSAACHKPSKLLVLKGADLREIMLSDQKLGFLIMERFCLLLRDRIQAAYGAMEKI